MQIGRWGNSLAVRLPKALVDRYGLEEGDFIEGQVIEKALAEARDQEGHRQREEALERIRNTRLPLPDDWTFDRDEANWRPATDRW